MSVANEPEYYLSINNNSCFLLCEPFVVSSLHIYLLDSLALYLLTYLLDLQEIFQKVTFHRQAIDFIYSVNICWPVFFWSLFSPSGLLLKEILRGRDVSQLLKAFATLTQHPCDCS